MHFNHCFCLQFGPIVDNLSEEIEFNRLTTDDREQDRGENSEKTNEGAESSEKSDMMLLQQLTNKKAID